MTRSHLYLRAKRGKRDELIRELDRLEVLVAVRAHAGFLSAEVQVPFDDDDHVLVVGAWSSPEHYERWVESTTRAELLRELEPLLAEAPATALYHVVDAVG
jgi:quinol monooxygenase YgiN